MLGDAATVLGERPGAVARELTKYYENVRRGRLSELAATAVVSFAGGAVELRVGGVEKQVAAVCPPSVGTDGVARRWNGVWRIFPIPEAVICDRAYGN